MLVATSIKILIWEGFIFSLEAIMAVSDKFTKPGR
jgi:hypothetical protein